MITESQLRQIMPNLPGAKAQQLLPHLNEAMAAYGIGTAMRTAAFVAQLAHESGEFRWMEEIWGPTAAQRRYEPPSDLAARLGNRQAGDGKRFKGRGPIQITGRFNYEKYGDLLGVDLVAQPERAATPEVAFAVAGLYWKSRGLNELADQPDFKEITRRINGGFNGLVDRQKYYERAKAVLATGLAAGPEARAATVAAAPVEPLERGAEAIRELVGEVRPTARKKAAAKKKVTAKKKAVAKKRVTTKQKVAARKRPAARKAAAKKPTTKTAAGKQRVTKKAAAKKAVTEKPVAKKAVAKKPAAKKATAKKSMAKKTAAKQAVAKKAAAR